MAMYNRQTDRQTAEQAWPGLQSGLFPRSRSDRGNTSIPYSITGMEDTTTRSSCWSITINNPTEEDRNQLKSPPTWVKSCHHQDEIGDNGTLHIQGAVLTAQVRFSQLKKWLPRAHIEVARNRQALLKYVKKPETSVEGTQQDTKGGYISMEQALRNIAEHSQDMEAYFSSGDRTFKDCDAWKKFEFWCAVRQVLIVSPALVGLYTNPQMERAWVNTRSVWIKLKSNAPVYEIQSGSEGQQASGAQDRRSHDQGQGEQSE